MSHASENVINSKGCKDVNVTFFEQFFFPLLINRTGFPHQKYFGACCMKRQLPNSDRLILQCRSIEASLQNRSDLLVAANVAADRAV